MQDLLLRVGELADPTKRDLALSVIGTAGDDGIVALREGLSHPSWRVRQWCCRTLDDAPLDGLTFARLVSAAKGDPHKKVRQQALHALGCDGCKPVSWSLDSGLDLTGLLLERLRNDRSVRVRRSAVTGLMFQVLVHGNTEARVVRALRAAVGRESDPALLRRATVALERAVQ